MERKHDERFARRICITELATNKLTGKQNDDKIKQAMKEQELQVKDLFTRKSLSYFTKSKTTK